MMSLVLRLPSASTTYTFLWCLLHHTYTCHTTSKSRNICCFIHAHCVHSGHRWSSTESVLYQCGTGLNHEQVLMWQVNILQSRMSRKRMNYIQISVIYVTYDIIYDTYHMIYAIYHMIYHIPWTYLVSQIVAIYRKMPRDLDMPKNISTFMT